MFPSSLSEMQYLILLDILCGIYNFRESEIPNNFKFLNNASADSDPSKLNNFSSETKISDAKIFSSVITLCALSEA
jgi:hypothetical protein